MSSEPQLFRINPETHDSESIREVEFADLGFQERRHIQEWIAKNPGILGDELLIIGKEFSDFDRTNERLDLLAVDVDGRLVVIELKRDDSGSDVHWQAIKYASYLHRVDTEDIVGCLPAMQKCRMKMQKTGCCNISIRTTSTVSTTISALSLPATGSRRK